MTGLAFKVYGSLLTVYSLHATVYGVQCRVEVEEVRGVGFRG